MSAATVTLSDVTESIDYGVTASSAEAPIGPKFLRITDIQDDAVNWDAVPYCAANSKGAEQSALRPGDIVFARTGATTGKSYLIKSCPPRAVFASYLIRVRPGPKVLPAYLAHFFQTSDYWQQIKLQAAGVAQPGVNATKLAGLKIPLAPLEEQKRIAAILDQADELRRKRQRALDRLGQLGQAIFHEMFGDWDTEGGVVAREPLGNSISYLTSGSRGWAEFYRETGDLFLRIQNVKRDELLLDDTVYVEAPNNAESRRTKVQPGDVLLSITADLGRTCVVPDNIATAYINQHLVIIRTHRYVPRFLSAALSSPAGQRVINQRNRAGVKAGLNFDDIRSFEMPVPGRDKQMELAARLDAIDRQKKSIARSVEVYGSLFLALQHRAFRGEL